jgi:hypothetical protein
LKGALRRLKAPRLTICQESNFKSIWMDDDPPAALERFLEYLYTFRPSVATRCMYDKDSGMRALLDLCKIADRYDQPMLLEQVFDEFDEHNLLGMHEDKMSVEKLLLAYKEINEMGDSAWLCRIRETVLESLLKPEKLVNLTAGCKKALAKNPTLVCALIELLADKCKQQENDMGEHSYLHRVSIATDG